MLSADSGGASFFDAMPTAFAGASSDVEPPVFPSLWVSAPIGTGGCDDVDIMDC